MPDEPTDNGEHGAILIALAEIKVQLTYLPCTEGRKRHEELDNRVKSLESDASFARGAANATHIIFGLVMVGIVSVGGLVLQIVRMMGER
jgi:hypothetical protein